MSALPTELVLNVSSTGNCSKPGDGTLDLIIGNEDRRISGKVLAQVLADNSSGNDTTAAPSSDQNGNPFSLIESLLWQAWEKGPSMMATTSRKLSGCHHVSKGERERARRCNSTLPVSEQNVVILIPSRFCPRAVSEFPHRTRIRFRLKCRVGLRR